MQKSIFIVHHYLRFKKWKLDFFTTDTTRKTSKIAFFLQPCAARIKWHTGAPEAVTLVQILQFLSLFRAFFRHEMSWNLGWIFPNLYCLQKNSKNHRFSFFISLIFHVMSYFANLHDFSLKKLKSTPIVNRIKFHLLLSCSREMKKSFNIIFDKILSHKNEILYLFSCLQSFSTYREIYVFRRRETTILKSFYIAYYKKLYTYIVNQ